MLYFVYGSLLNGLHNHYILGDSKFIGNGTLEGFSMYSLHYYPAIIKSEGKPAILGELYEVSNPDIEHDLDILEGYSKNSIHSYYNKEIVKVNCNGEMKEAYVYVFNNPKRLETKKIVKSGDWRAELNSQKSQFVGDISLGD